MHIAHILYYYDLLVNVYCDAASIGIAVAHCGEFYLERWWMILPPGEAEERFEAQ